MCGIAGYYYRSGKRITDTATVITMLNCQRHRGPDDSGIRAISLKDKTSIELDFEELDISLDIEITKAEFEQIVQPKQHY